MNNRRREIIGIFFGNSIDRPSITIIEAYPFRVGHRTGVEFEDQDYEKAAPIIKDCERRGLGWLGWFHSHPFRGDSIYMSSTDVQYQFFQQQLNPLWTAIVLNPNQVRDPNTTKGARAYQLWIPSTSDINRCEIMQIHLEIVQKIDTQ